MNKRKRAIIALAMAGLIVAGTVASAFAVSPVAITVNGQSVQSEASFINGNGRTMVPISFIAERLGYSVTWQADTRTAIFKSKDVTVDMKVGTNYFTRNGTKVDMDTYSVINKNRTIVPLNAVATALGSKVEWDENTRVVSVVSGTSVAEVPATTKPAGVIADNIPAYSNKIIKEFSSTRELVDSKYMEYMIVDELKGKTSITIDFITDKKVVKSIKTLENFEFEGVNADYVAVYTTLDKEVLVAPLKNYDNGGN